MKKILVIDDEKAIIDGLFKMLSSWGYQVKTAMRGLNGIGYLQSEQFDLVVVDLKMPDINGIELLKRIKEISPEIKIIVLSGSLGEVNFAELNELNIFKLLEKPISRKDIQASIQEALGVSKSDAEIKSEKKAIDFDVDIPIKKDSDIKFFSKGNILVVDDNESLAITIKNILSFKNYNVTIASDGEIALEKIKSQKFNLILMDINMPKMNGIEAVKRMKAINPDLFIVMMTGEASDEEIEKAIKEGGYAVLRKPFSPERLLKSISWFRDAEENIRFRKAKEEASREAPKKEGLFKEFRHKIKKNIKSHRSGILTISFIVISIIIGILLVFYIENVREGVTRYYTTMSSKYENYMDKVVGYLERDERRELKQK